MTPCCVEAAGVKPVLLVESPTGKGERRFTPDPPKEELTVMLSRSLWLISTKRTPTWISSVCSSAAPMSWPIKSNISALFTTRKRLVLGL